MPISIYDSSDGKEEKKGGITNIAPGVIKNNCDRIMQGKVQVRIPSKGLDVWARVSGAGGGMGRGLMWVPQEKDEVLVAFNAEDVRDAYILSGLWSNLKRLPATTPEDTRNKRTIRTGFTPLDGHEMTFDDALKTVTLRATTGQTITLSPTGVEIEANDNTLIKLIASPGASPGAVQIIVGDNTITMSPSGIDVSSSKTLNLSATNINITGTNVNVKGTNVMIN